MLKRFTPLLLLLILLTVPQTVFAQKTFYWESFDVDVRLREDGTLDVTEHQTIVFGGGDFTFGFATIPHQRLDDIRNITVREGDRVFDRSSTRAPYTFEVTESSSEIRIDWYFPPTSGEHTYTFGYTVDGAVRVEETGSQVFWMAIPEDIPGRVDSSNVTIQVPQGVQIGSTIGQIGGVESGVFGTIDSDGRRAVFETTGAIFPGEALEVGVRFPVEQLPKLSVPDWQRREQMNDVYGLALLAVSTLVLIGGPILVLGLWYTRGRDPDIGVVPEYIVKPPSDLPPALVGSLVDEKVQLRDIVSTLVDLARRGYLDIEEQKGDHVYNLTDKDQAGLRNFERSLVRAFFGNRKSKALSSLRYKFADKIPQLQGSLYQEVVREGLFNRSPESVRGGYRAVGVVGIFAAIATFLFLGAALQGVDTAACLGIAMIPAALAMIYTATHMPRKTEKGALEAAKWDAFKEYLGNIKKYSGDSEIDADAGKIFNDYLAYAIAFGLERSFMKQFSQTYTNVPIPTWYHPYYPRHGRYRGGRRGGTQGGGAAGIPSGGGMSPPTLEGMSGGMTRSLDGMSQGLTRMLNSTSTIMRSVKTPEPSSSGGGFGGGGGGFSGGFGGGSSGGGSRGFG